MQITNVEITIVPPNKGRSSKGHLKAYASITIDECFIVRDLKVIRTQDKLFVAMPSKLDKNKNIHRDIAHPINKETRAMIQQAVFDEYDKQVQQLKLNEKNVDQTHDEPSKQETTESEKSTN